MLKQLRKLNSWKKYSFNSLYCAENLHTTTQRLVEENPQENKPMGKINSMLDKYDPEQEEKILKIINNYSLNDLLGYEISKARANKLIAWRKRYGLLNSLNDVFSVEGFGIKIAENFFQSLLLEPKANELKLGKAQRKLGPFITPPLEVEQREAIKSTVSIRIGVNSVTWSRLDIPGKKINAPCLLTHWQHHEISGKKLHINELVERCLYVNHLIPTADCYLFENPQMAQASNNPGSVEQQNINIQKAQIIAILGYALTSRKLELYNEMNNETIHVAKKNNLPSIFYVKRFLPGRLFYRLVGTDRASSEEMILNMMRTFYNTEHSLPEQYPDTALQPCDNNEKFSGRVQFPIELREMFSKAPPNYREFLGQSLLLNLAFVRLVLLQDAESIAKLSRAGNNEKVLIK